jgi:hypothetical protein
MATRTLPPDFAEFLRLLNSHGAEYLLVGGYAVGYYGYPRATADMDVWVARTEANGVRLVAALRAFGFDTPALAPDLFGRDNQVVRLGNPPFRIELLTSVSGVQFDACHAARTTANIDDVDVPLISLADLKTNKRAAGRHKDLDDLEHLL